MWKSRLQKPNSLRRGTDLGERKTLGEAALLKMGKETITVSQRNLPKEIQHDPADASGTVIIDSARQNGD